MKQAVDAGAQVTMPVADMFWGDRYGQLVDPFGHRWSMATHKLDLTPEEIRQNMEKMGGCGGRSSDRAQAGFKPGYGPRKSSLPIFTPWLRRMP